MTNGRVSFEHKRKSKGMYDVLQARIAPNASLEFTLRSSNSETWKYTIVKRPNDSRRIVEISHPDGSNQTIKNGTFTSTAVRRCGRTDADNEKLSPDE
jgi:hypothetical protein